MKITYTAPNRSHHYPYATALFNAGHLHAFVCGFSRFSPRSPLPAIGDKLKRHDFFQNVYLAANKAKAPFPVVRFANRLSNVRLDAASFSWAKDSDVFIHYRTQGYNTTQKLRRQGYPTLCVMEEVNSHVAFANEILQKEFRQAGLAKSFEKEADYSLRLKAYEQADCILCPSEFVKRSFLRKGFAEERLLKVPFGFTLSGVPPQASNVSNQDVFRVLYVGQLHYRKGLRYALEAFRKLKHPKKEFVIVGPKTTITGLERTVIPGGVVFTGALKGEALKEQYGKATVFILPSLEEGLALVQGEALSMGLPLLITTHTGGDDLITDGVEGFIVEPANAEALADRLQQMADDKALLQSLSQAALRAAQTLGSWDKAAQNLITQLTDKVRSRQLLSAA